MELEFAHPLLLLLIPVAIALVIAICLWSRRKYSKGLGKNKYRIIGEIILRCLCISLGILALSGVSIKKDNNVITTIFLLDMSDSTKAQWDNEVEFVRKAISDMPENNQAGIVAFGNGAQIEQFVSDKKVFTSVQSEVSGTATDIKQAVSSAIALFPEGTAKRMVLLSDGMENQEAVADIGATVANSDIEFKSVNYKTKIENEVYVDKVELPDSIGKGDKYKVNVKVYSTEATKAKVSLYSGQTLTGQKDVSLQVGDNQLVFMDQGVEEGIKSYRVVVESEKDTVSVNNTYSAFTTVESQDKILLVEGKKGQGAEFEKLLKSINVDYDLREPSSVPKSLSDMLVYKSVILLDVHGDDLGNDFMGILKTYVGDYAGGLVAIGGENSYALGNYKNTPLEEILPVSSELQGEKEIPKMSMVMVIDHSGSMDAPSAGNASFSCLDMAKQAAIGSLEALRPTDEVGVVSFDDEFMWSVPLQSAADQVGAQEGIESIPSGGGTSIYPALEEAVNKIKDSDATYKHVILLTDGQDYYREYDPLIKKINDNKITLSTVAVGRESDTTLMTALAEAGKGRYYYTDGASDLPRIFAQEVYLSTEEYIKNKEFTPVLTNSHEILQGVFDEGSPSLLGYIGTTAKSTSTVLLESDEEMPILAVWQYGLGKTVSWTSDGENKWTGNFASWNNYQVLWKNIIDWSKTNTDPGEDTVSVNQKASSVEITYQTKEYGKDTRISAVVTDEKGKTREVNLQGSTPGKYTTEVPLDETGVYTVSIRNKNGDKVVKNINTATAMQYSKEYKFADMSSSLDTFLKQVDGITIDSTDKVFDTKLEGSKMRTDLFNSFLIIAIIIFALDVLCRRMSINWFRVLSEKILIVKAGVISVAGNVKTGFETESGKGRDTQLKTDTSRTVEEPAKQVSNGLEKEQKATKQKIQNKKQRQEKKKETTQHIDTTALLNKKRERDL